MAQLEDLSYQTSEQAFRIQFLRDPGEAAPASVAGGQSIVDEITCDKITSNINTSLDSAADLIKSTLTDPITAPLAKILDKFIENLKGGFTRVLRVADVQIEEHFRLIRAMIGFPKISQC